jgi:hypothetical protein
MGDYFKEIMKGIANGSIRFYGGLQHIPLQQNCQQKTMKSLLEIYLDDRTTDVDPR